MILRATLTIACLATLAACADQRAPQPAPQPAPPAQMAPDPNGPPFIEGSFSASDAATTACRDLLASQTSGGVSVVGSESSEAAHAVYMRVGANGAPWRCLVGGDGSNPSVMFMGNEGAA